MATLLFFLLQSLVLSSFPPLSSSISDSLHKDSSLSVEKPSHFLISPNEIFTAGFHAVGVNAYCFAIWFTKPSHVHNRTIVWMANRDQPINGRLSKLSLLKTGNLILTDAGQSISWATNTVSSSSSQQLQLYNSGNLVLRTREGVVLWQSFDSPTDTLLPNQALTRYTKLISSRSQTNHSSGFYKLFFDDDNVLRMIFDGPETSSIYWPDPWELSYQANRTKYNDTRIAVFDSAGHFKSSDRFEFRAADFGMGPQRRLTLDFDGNLRLYSLQEAGGTWVVSWQTISTTCRIHGACGPNSLCSYDAVAGRTCSCLPRFKIKNDRDWSYGCEPEFNLFCKHGEAAFIKLPGADFYGYNIRILRNYSLEMCENKCLELCNCRGFHYRFNDADGVYDCYPKRVFRNGHRSPNFIGALYLKVPKDVMSNDEPLEEFKLGCSNNDTKQLDRAYKRERENWQLKFLLWFTCGFGLFEIVCILLVLCCLYRARQRSHAETKRYLPAATGFRKFTYSELKNVTRGFSEEIGRGGAGVVFKGTLSDGRVAAIKRLNEAKQGEEEFLAEVSTIGRLNHMNLIEMWGYCAEGKHRLLVYEYMENGSLAENLQSNTLDWEKRFNIAVGTAKGLAYLHEECLEWVLHCDVKPHNILLDSSYQPKVSDFGLSKLLNRGCENNPSFSRIRGTRGYMAPEWVSNLPITSKVDVYSFGIVVLEMVTTGISSIGKEGKMEQRRLVNWVSEKRSRGSLMASLTEEIIDPMMSGRLEILIGVALHCVEEDRDARPTMSQVIEVLLSQQNDY